MNIQILVKHIAGSVSYGTNVPSSDLDIRGIYLPNKKDYLSCFKAVKEKVEEGDVKYWDLRQFIRLATKGSPNILETLWVPKRFIQISSAQFELLRKNRPLFLSQKIKSTFLGFAKSQRESFITAALIAEYDESPSDFKAPYKAAMHYIRILRMGCELAEEGELNVYRRDRNSLLEIRNGGRSSASIIEEGTILEQRLKKGFSVSSFPKEPDYDKIDELFLSIV